MPDTSSTASLLASRDSFSPGNTRYGNRVILFAILLAIVLAVGGSLYYKHQYAEAHQAMEGSLSSIAALKSESIQNWVHERRGDADVARFSQAVHQALDPNANSATRKELARIIGIFRDVYNYSAVIVTDPAGKVQLMVPGDFAMPQSEIADQVQLALHSPQVAMSYLTRSRPNEPLYVWGSCPIFETGKTDGEPIGAVLLLSDPHKFLYPTVQQQSDAAHTMKYFLVLRENGRVTGLNDSLGPVDTGETAGLNSGRPNLSAIALRGTDGIFEALDPQGIPVFAAIRNIPDTPWLIVVTISQDEILAPVRWDAWNAGVISCLLVLATALGAVLYGRQQKLQFVKNELAERHRAADALAASERRFRRLIENASDIITVVNKDCILRFVSPSAKSCLGYEPEELLNQNALELTHPDDVANVSAVLGKLVTEPGSTATVEYRFRHRDGSWRVLQSVGRTLPDTERDVMIVVNSRDITENRLLQKQFFQAQKMESIGHLAGGIAHDFNNFLSIIIGYCDLLELELPENEKTNKRCEEIKKAGHSAAALTRQLLAFSRQQVLEPRVLDLNATVVSMAKMLRRLIGEDIQFTNELSPALRRIKADPGQIEQVIMNLAVNARDAMPSGGKLAIATANIDFDEDLARLHHPSKPGPYVVLTVSDNGCGMNADTQARIFEPFFTTKEQGKGTGLGLATVYGIVKQSGGYIWVYSEPGYGTTFKVYFPVTGEIAEDAKAGPAPAESWRGTETILVVEDQDALREMVRTFLVSNGYTVLLADGPEDAMKIVRERKHHIDLLLTDLVMPGMNGHALARNLTAANPEIKVVYMSGYVGFMHRELINPTDVLINKPFTRATLLQKLREVLEFRPEFQPH